MKIGKGVEGYKAAPSHTPIAATTAVSEGETFMREAAKQALNS